MITTTLTAYRTSAVTLHLIDVQDTGHALVNQHHFALQRGRPTDISAALTQPVNAIHLVVQNAGRLLGGDWHGHFEVFVNGKLVGAYADHGTDLRTNQNHTVAEITLQIVTPPPVEQGPESAQIIHKLHGTPGMTTADKKDAHKGHPVVMFQNGVVISLYKNIAGIDHVFVLDQTGTCVFGGYVGWIHAAGLQKIIAEIQQEYRRYLA